MMSLGQRLVHHPRYEQFKENYRSNVSLDVFLVCADWIEENIAKEQHILDDHDVVASEHRAVNFMRFLINRLECAIVNHVSQKNNIEKAIRTFKQHGQYNSLVQFRQIFESLKLIKNLLEPSMIFHISLITEINTTLDMLYNHLLAIKDQQKQLEIHKHLEQPNSTHTFNTANELTHNIGAIISQIQDVQQIVIVERLARWRREQALSVHTAEELAITLDQIQEWFVKLSYLVSTMRNVIDGVRKHNEIAQLNMQSVYDTFFVHITKQLEFIIVSGFIVEKQPPQVMKTNTKFSVSVRLLTANLRISENPLVTVSLISEHEAQRQQKHNIVQETSGEIECRINEFYLQTQQPSGHLSCHFPLIHVKNIKRTDRKGSESVMEEKFSLLFKASFISGDLHINVWSLSLPVVVTVHGVQEPQSWATINWDNTFSEIYRTPFFVVDQVTWSQMAKMLNTVFASQTGRHLTNDNLNYLFEKAFPSLRNTIPDDQPMTWQQFCKYPLAGHKFTFWEWFYANMKLTREHLRGPWNDNSIIGFVSKRKSEEMLSKCPPGTFLLRFSDSVLGGITIAWSIDTAQGIRVEMVEPSTSKDFVKRNLSQQIDDISKCVTLYPNIPKYVAFGKFLTATERPVNNRGYLPKDLRFHVQSGSKYRSPEQIYQPLLLTLSSVSSSPDNTTDTSKQVERAVILREPFTQPRELFPARHVRGDRHGLGQHWPFNPTQPYRQRCKHTV